LYCWFKLKKKSFFEENNTHLPLNYQNTTAKPLFQQTASGLFLFILQFLKSLPVLSPVIHNFSFSTYLSYIHFPSFCPLCHQCFFIFHLKKKTLSFLFVPLHNWIIKKKGDPSSFSPKQNPNHTFRSRSFVLNLCHILFRKCVCQICIKLLINFSPLITPQFCTLKTVPCSLWLQIFNQLESVLKSLSLYIYFCILPGIFCWAQFMNNTGQVKFGSFQLFKNSGFKALSWSIFR